MQTKKAFVISILCLTISCAKNGLIQHTEGEGLIYECEFKDGKKHGEFKRYVDPTNHRYKNRTTIKRTFENGRIVGPEIRLIPGKEEYEEIEYVEYIDEFTCYPSEWWYDDRFWITKSVTLKRNNNNLIKMVYNTDSIIKYIKKENKNGYIWGCDWGGPTFESFTDSIIFDTSILEKIYYTNTLKDSAEIIRIQNRFDKIGLEKPILFPIWIAPRQFEKGTFLFNTYTLELLDNRDTRKNDTTIQYAIESKTNDFKKIYPISLFRQRNEPIHGLWVFDGECKTYDQEGKLIEKVKYTNGHLSRQNSVFALNGY